jgi:hypothetical protein
MSIDTFVADPAGYSKGHVIQFQHQAFPPAQAGMTVAATMNHWAGNWTAEAYQMIPGQFTKFRFHESGLQYFHKGQAITMPDRIGTGSKALHTVEVDSGNIDLGIRYLPWKADTVTFMAFDGAATTFFTGPINGCSIYLCQQPNGTWWAFHANRNNAGGHNAGVKAAMTNAVHGQLPIALNIVHQVVYLQEYQNFGFVCGQIKHGQWVFYVVDTRMKTRAGEYATTVNRLP